MEARIDGAHCALHCVATILCSRDSRSDSFRSFLDLDLAVADLSVAERHARVLVAEQARYDHLRFILPMSGKS